MPTQTMSSRTNMLVIPVTIISSLTGFTYDPIGLGCSGGFCTCIDRVDEPIHKVRSMIRKIISSGQCGVESAALDTAIKLGIAYDGWTPLGRRNDDGRLPAEYDLKETSSPGFEEALKKNILLADGLLVISKGVQTTRSTQAVRMALKQERQFLHIDLKQYGLFEAASLSCSWLFQKQIKTVYVTGPSDLEEPLIYGQAQKLLETAFYLGYVKSELQSPRGSGDFANAGQEDAGWPATVEDAVGRLKASMSLKDRTTLANMQADELDRLSSGLGEYIKKNFGLYTGNEKLMQSCAKIGLLKSPLADEACAVILRALVGDLRRTHRLRIIK
jgi:hypothetical protein